MAMIVVPVTTTCPKCGKSVVQKPGDGRPEVYCGIPCRRLAEYEIKRVQRAIVNAEDEQKEWRQRADLGMHDDLVGQPGLSARKADWYAGEVARLEARLRELVGG